MNVFKYGWMPWRYPANWWDNIKLFFRQFKWAYQRAVHGFADCDIWNLDQSILEYLHGTLDALADNHYGYPGNENFPTDESWTEFLKDMAQKFYQASESNDYYPTPKAEEWWDYINERCADNIFKDIPEDEKLVELRDAMLEESRENDRMRMRDFAEAWSLIGDCFFDLWD